MRTGRPGGARRIVIDGDLRAQWNAIVALLRANRENVVVVTVGPRAETGGRRP